MKQALFQQVIQKLEAELARQLGANASSNAGAAFSASGAEKQRDTSGYEAAHLARGHARLAAELRRQLAELKTLPVEDFTGQEIDIGAVVEVDFAGDTDTFLLLPCGGGMEVEGKNGRTVTVITPEAPLGKALMGNIEAGFVELPSGLEGIILRVW